MEGKSTTIEKRNSYASVEFRVDPSPLPVVDFLAELKEFFMATLTRGGISGTEGGICAVI